jgi:hypothetical protein
MPDLSAQPVRENEEESNKSAPDSINQFLSKWQTLPSGGEECLPHEHLVALAKGKGRPEWSDHVASCSPCGEILNVLRDRSMQVTRFMDEFMKQKADNAQLISSRQSSSLWSYLKALQWINQPRWGAYALTISSVALIVFGVWSYKHEFSARQNPPQIAYLEKDDFSYAAKTLQAAITDLPPSISPERKTQDIVAINKVIGRANESMMVINRLYSENKIQPDQRGQINDLVVNYRSRLGFLRQSVDVAQQSKPARQITTPDTDSVISILSAIDQVNSKKNFEDVSSQTELQEAEMIRDVDFAVVRIDTEASSKILSFQRRVSEMSPEEKGTLETNLNANPFVTKRGLKVKILPGTALTSARGAGTIAVPN